MGSVEVSDRSMSNTNRDLRFAMRRHCLVSSSCVVSDRQVWSPCPVSRASTSIIYFKLISLARRTVAQPIKFLAAPTAIERPAAIPSALEQLSSVLTFSAIDSPT